MSGTAGTYMLNGKKVMSKKVNGFGSMDISGLAEGVYLLKINDRRIKFVK